MIDISCFCLLHGLSSFLLIPCSQITDQNKNSKTTGEEVLYDDVVVPGHLSEENTYDDIVVPTDQLKSSTHLNNSNNKSDVARLPSQEENVYDDVVPPTAASGGVLGPQDQPKAETDANRGIYVNGNAKPRKNRPTNLDMPTRYSEARESNVKVAAIVHLSQPEPPSYDTMLSYAVDQPEAVQPRYASSPKPSPAGNRSSDPTIYEVDCLGRGVADDGMGSGGEGNEDSGWHENELYEGRGGWVIN